MRSRAVRMLALLLALLPTAAAAQTVTGRVVDEGSRAPVQGALVRLIAEDGALRGGSLSAADGTFRITAPAPGRYSLQAQRIGFADAVASPFDLATGATVERTLALRARAVQLEGIVAQARRRCTVRGGDGQLVARLWDEARKALEAAAFTEGERLFGFDVRTHVRVLDPSSLRVIRDSALVRQSYGERSPFISLPVDRLLADGFIQVRGPLPEYYAPDAAALLSDDFASAYCWGIQASHRDDPRLVGITFEPRERRGPAAVRGTLWLDRGSAELRWLEYSYTRTGSGIAEDHRLGGRVEFEPLPSGAWIVRRWWIRMPSGQAAQPLTPTPAMRTREAFASIVEEGGEVLEIRSAAGHRRADTSGAVLEGVVYDSTRSAPLAGALVFVSGTVYSDTTDEQGSFRIAPIQEGRYEVTFSHPDLGRAGFVPRPRAVSVTRGESSRVDLHVPATARRDAALQRCPATGATSGPSGVIAGRVVDELTRTPIARARVSVTWGVDPGEATDGSPTRTLTVATASDGSFLICGLPARRPMSLHAAAMGESGSRRQLDGLGSLAFAEHDLSVRLTREHDLDLVVLDSETRAPVVEAIVSFPELDRRAVTDRQGRARLEALPPGPQTVEVRHIGYGTQRDRLLVDASEPALEIRLSPRAIEIEGVRVVARSAAEEARRRSGGRQSLLTRDRIAELEGSALHVGDLVRRLPGVRVREVRLPGSSIIDEICIESSRGSMRDTMAPCSEPVVVVLDGRPIFDPKSLLDLSPTELESVEYLTSSQAAGLYMGGARGVLVVYTRGNGPFASRATR